MSDGSAGLARLAADLGVAEDVLATYIRRDDELHRELARVNRENAQLTEHLHHERRQHAAALAQVLAERNELRAAVDRYIAWDAKHAPLQEQIVTLTEQRDEARRLCRRLLDGRLLPKADYPWLDEEQQS